MKKPYTGIELSHPWSSILVGSSLTEYPARQLRKLSSVLKSWIRFQKNTVNRLEKILSTDFKKYCQQTWKNTVNRLEKILSTDFKKILSTDLKKYCQQTWKNTVNRFQKNTVNRLEKILSTDFKKILSTDLKKYCQQTWKNTVNRLEKIQIKFHSYPWPKYCFDRTI